MHDHTAALRDLPQGWFHHADRVLDLLVEHRPKVVVELGTWRGASAIAIARTIASWGGVLYCVDTWTGDVNGSWGKVPGYPGMLAECADNLRRAGVADRVRLIASTTVAAAHAWPVDGESVNFLYVDADHSRESVLADLAAWYPLVSSGGVICGDDYDNVDYPGAKEAWDEFCAENKLDLKLHATPNTQPAGMKLAYTILPTLASISNVSPQQPQHRVLDPVSVTVPVVVTPPRTQPKRRGGR